MEQKTKWPNVEDKHCARNCDIKCPILTAAGNKKGADNPFTITYVGICGDADMISTKKILEMASESCDTPRKTHLKSLCMVPPGQLYTVTPASFRCWPRIVGIEWWSKQPASTLEGLWAVFRLAVCKFCRPVTRMV